MRLRLIAALAVAVVASGGYLMESGGDPAGSGGSPWGGARVAAQPGIVGAGVVPGASVSPGASGSPRPSGPPRPSGSPSGTPKPTVKPKPKPTGFTAPPSSASMVNTLLAQVNALRAKNGLPPYTLLAGLDRSAHAHN